MFSPVKLLGTLLKRNQRKEKHIKVLWSSCFPSLVVWKESVLLGNPVLRKSPSRCCGTESAWNRHKVDNAIIKGDFENLTLCKVEESISEAIEIDHLERLISLNSEEVTRFLNSFIVHLFKVPFEIRNWIGKIFENLPPRITTFSNICGKI